MSLSLDEFMSMLCLHLPGQTGGFTSLRLRICAKTLDLFVIHLMICMFEFDYICKFELLRTKYKIVHHHLCLKLMCSLFVRIHEICKGAFGFENVEVPTRSLW